MDDDSTLSGLGPLTAILVVFAFTLLGGLLYGVAGTRHNRDPQPTDRAPATAARSRKRRSPMWRLASWTLREIARSFT
jgi:hypothetical protein